MELLATLVLALPVIYAVGFFAWRLGPRVLRGVAAVGASNDDADEALEVPPEEPSRAIERMRQPADGDPPLPRD